MPDIRYNCPECNENQIGFDVEVDVTEYATDYGYIDEVEHDGWVDTTDLERDYNDSESTDVRLACPDCGRTILWQEYDVGDFIEDNPLVFDEDDDDEPTPAPSSDTDMSFITISYGPPKQPCMFSEQG